MPLAECNICNRRFHGRYSFRVMKAHQTKMHKHHNNKPPVHVSNDVSLLAATDIIWAGLPLRKRCSLLATFFIEQSHDSNPGGVHDNDTVDGEILSEHRAG